MSETIDVQAATTQDRFESVPLEEIRAGQRLVWMTGRADAPTPRRAQGCVVKQASTVPGPYVTVRFRDGRISTVHVDDLARHTASR